MLLRTGRAYVVICPHGPSASQVVEFDPLKTSGSAVVDAWSRRHGNEGVTWKVAEANNVVGALIESSRLSRAVASAGGVS